MSSLADSLRILAVNTGFGEIEEAADEIESLRSRLAELERDLDLQVKDCIAAIAEAQLRGAQLTEADALRKDAERYRWLRNESTATLFPLASVVWKVNGDRHGSAWCNASGAYQMDFAIDYAIAERKPLERPSRQDLDEK